MRSDVDDVRFRIEVAARVLERAAARSDPELRIRLLEIAENLRSIARGARARTVDELVKEIREIIWRKGVGTGSAGPDPIEQLLLKPLNSIEEVLSGVEKKLEELTEVLPL